MRSRAICENIGRVHVLRQRFRSDARESLWLQGMGIGLLCAALVFLGRGLFAGLERGALDAMFVARGTRYPFGKIVLVVVDDFTVSNKRFGSWPLPRRIHADVVRRLTQAGAKSIAFDVMFSVPASNAEDDALLAQACFESGRVTHASAFHVPQSMIREGNGSSLEVIVAPNPRFSVTEQGSVECLSASGGTSARLPLQRSAVAAGHVNVFPELADGALRKIPHLIRYREKTYPSLALATAAHALNLKPSQIIARNGEVDLGGRRIPIDSYGEAWVNWVGGNGSFPMYTYQDVLSTDPAERIEDEAFKDAIVLIGVTATGAFDHHATPFSSNQPAVELQANALDDILSYRPLHELARPWQIVLLFLYAILAGAVMIGHNARNSALRLLFLGLGLWVGALLLLSRANLYVPIATPLFAAVMTGGVCLGYRQLQDSFQLRVAEERYALAVRGANDGVWDWNLRDDRIYYSPRWKAMLGLSDAEVSSSPDEWFSRVHAEDIDRVRRKIDDHLEGRDPHFECEYRMCHQDESYRWVLSRGLKVVEIDGKSKGNPSRMAGSQTDVTERRLAQEELVTKALYDELTGLPNRTLFMDRLRHSLAIAKRRDDYLFAVLFLDIDRFKVVNDSLGHIMGDELLKVMARRLELCLRPNDTVARLGGDEFTMLLDDIAEVNDAIRVAERVQSELSQPIDLAGHEHFTTASIGIAVSVPQMLVNGQPSTRYEYPEDLLRDADTAMYRAKSLGRSRHEVFDEAMHANAVALLKLETDLRRALERQNFQVYYQPIINLQTGRLIGFEALARWLHPERGLVPPAEFIQFAEDTGLIIPIDQLVLREACRQTKAWHKLWPSLNSHSNAQHAEDTLMISVNLSSKQFARSEMVPHIEQTLRETELDASHLKLEITESVIMQNAEASEMMLRELKALGIRLSIDDFGTGYSSLSYLHRFPLDMLKVDRSFVSRMKASGEDCEIVDTIITLAHNLNLQVIAEGVETEDQLALLRRMKCDYGQGYLFSRPVDSVTATEMIAANKVW
ncbi:MAG: hypothetical protein JWN98_2098 [Abditibacteriota bacterium]|nr:hypothetical protein [Abditibacteriota bacterium]